jgi:hypothetical protein
MTKRIVTWVGSIALVVCLIWALVATIRLITKIDNLVKQETQHLETLHQNLNGAAEAVEDLDALIKTLDRASGAIPGKLDDFNAKVDKVSGTVDSLAGNVDKQLAAFNGTLKTIAEPTARAETLFTEQFLVCPGNPGCFQSRFLAISGELMRTMDSSRRMMAKIETATPTFLERFDQFTKSGVLIAEQGRGIAEDFHTITSKYAHPDLKSKIYGGLVDAAKIGILIR